MGIVQEQRERVAKVVGAKLANDFADDQLPAILHAIDGDEHEVRVVAQKVERSKGVDNPGALMMWMLREQRHTGLVQESRGGVVVTPLPALPDEEELARRRVLMREWTKIYRYIQRYQDCKDLFNELRSTYPDDKDEHIIHETMLHVIDAMEAQ